MSNPFTIPYSWLASTDLVTRRHLEEFQYIILRMLESRVNNYH